MEKNSVDLSNTNLEGLNMLKDRVDNEISMKRLEQFQKVLKLGRKIVIDGVYLKKDTPKNKAKKYCGIIYNITLKNFGLKIDSNKVRNFNLTLDIKDA